MNKNSSASYLSEDILAIICAALLLAVSLFATWSGSGAGEGGEYVAKNPIADFAGKPTKWSASPIDAIVRKDAEGTTDYSPLKKIIGTWVFMALTLGTAVFITGGGKRIAGFLPAFTVVFLLAGIAYVIAANEVAKAYNLEYALWALGIGMLISNTIGTPAWLKHGENTGFFIKTGLVILGAEVLVSRLMALGLPGVCVAWIVTPIVLISTYWFGQRVLKMKSRTLNMVISADMSVCGVSAAIASAAACKAKKEELSLAIGMSLSFTVVMMVVLPIIIKFIGLNEYVGGAWLGGTIDSTGAVAAAGAVLGDQALEVAATVKMIQNILIGVAAFGIASYWVTRVEPLEGKQERSERPGLSEIWKRFPRFILGFIAVSILFSILHATLADGPAFIDQVIKGSTKTFRGWLFCLAFVSIGLETRFADLAKYLKGGKPVILYLCGQTLNLILTLAMAYLMFGILFKDSLQ
ncbi:MAG: putative sulfate exporter family transporter [Planctomycetota bacterium]